LYFGENKYQTTFAIAKGRVIYDFFGIGRLPNRPPVSTEIHQGGTVFFGEFLRNVGKNIFIGPRYQHRKLYARLGGEQAAGGFQIPDIDIQSECALLRFMFFGANNDLRGYTGGEFQNRRMFAAQAEFRKELKGRFGSSPLAVLAVSRDVGTNLGRTNFSRLPAPDCVSSLIRRTISIIGSTGRRPGRTYVDDRSGRGLLIRPRN
jgi:hypothetical protein